MSHKYSKVPLTYGLFTRTKEEWADIIGITVGQLNRRLRTWPIRKAMTTPGKNHKFVLAGKSDSLCWTCIHACPNPDTGVGCSWSRLEHNVEGSVARVRLQQESGVNRISNEIISCPQYVKSKRKNSLWRYKLNEYKGINN